MEREYVPKKVEHINGLLGSALRALNISKLFSYHDNLYARG